MTLSRDTLLFFAETLARMSISPTHPEGARDFARATRAWVEVQAALATLESPDPPA